MWLPRLQSTYRALRDGRSISDDEVKEAMLIRLREQSKKALLSSNEETSGTIQEVHQLAGGIRSDITVMFIYSHLSVSNSTFFLSCNSTHSESVVFFLPDTLWYTFSNTFSHIINPFLQFSQSVYFLIVDLPF